MRRFLFVMIAFAAMTASAVMPQRTCKVMLVVQNHAAPGTRIPMTAITDALTAKLSGVNFQVINPYNSVGINQNRTVLGEKTPSVSTMKLARQFNADGVITASVIEFLDIAVGEPSAPKNHQYSMRVSLNLADAQTGAAVCGETISKESPKYFHSQVKSKRQKYLSDLLYAATEECAEKLLRNPAVREWKQTPPGPKPLPEGTGLDKKVDNLVQEMLLNAQFIKNYEGSKAKQDGRMPIVVIGGIENKSGNAELNDLVEAAGERFRVKLFNSKLFDVKDDGVLVALSKRIVASGNNPSEDGEIMGALKQHGSPDFFVVGDFKRLTDLDGMGFYKLRLAIHSLWTGKTIWEGIETFKRKKGVTK